MSGDGPTTAAALTAALVRLAPASVTVGVRAVDPADASLLSSRESVLVATAVAVRRHEFATGRALLHDLLGTPEPVLRAPNGAPAGPAGSVVTLGHDHKFAVAAVASSVEVHALGIDLESVHEDDEELHAAVLRPDDHAPSAVAAFVVKEAAYKAWSTLGGGIVGPLDANATFEGSRFCVRFPDDALVSGNAIEAAGYWLALAVVPR